MYGNVDNINAHVAKEQEYVCMNLDQTEVLEYLIRDYDIPKKKAEELLEKNKDTILETQLRVNSSFLLADAIYKRARSCGDLSEDWDRTLTEEDFAS